MISSSRYKPIPILRLAKIHNRDLWFREGNSDDSGMTLGEFISIYKERLMGRGFAHKQGIDHKNTLLREITINQTTITDFTRELSAIVIHCNSGECSVLDNFANRAHLRAQDTILLSAQTRVLKITPLSGEINLKVYAMKG